MTFDTIKNICRAFLATTTSARVGEILGILGDSAYVGLNQPFGKFNLCWQTFGGRSTNISSVGLGTKPGRSLTERITNAVDGILEERVVPTIPNPPSVREAAAKWFGRPASGPEDGLFRWKYGDIDRRISVVLSASDSETAPTVDVLDDGIGILPEDFPRTILSLQGENKIKKRYLIGAFGQGGSSTLAFSDYVLIVSRNHLHPEIVGFTLIRVLTLDESYKEDCYAYLALSPTDNDATTVVPSFALSTVTEEIGLYATEKNIPLPYYKKGTLVRHFGYKLNGLENSLGPTPGNLYHHLHNLLFDPVLPFRLIDRRFRGKEKNEVVKGSRNRLMALALSKDEARKEGGTGNECRLHRSMEYVRPYGADSECVGIEYWVVFNYKQAKQDKGPVQLRTHSNEKVCGSRGCERKALGFPHTF